MGSEDQVGIQTLNIVSDDGGGSTLLGSTSVLKTENIEVKTLDRFNITNISFIIEGLLNKSTLIIYNQSLLVIVCFWLNFKSPALLF